MKKLVIAVAFLSMVCLLHGAENLAKGASYQVFPGDWNKSLLNSKTLGKGIDPDLDRTTNKRKGMLTDGKTFQRAVCYNYHWTKPEQRFVTAVIDLGKECSVDKVIISVMENNSAYKPAKYAVETSSDNMVFTAFANGSSWSNKTRWIRVAEAAAAPKKCRYVRVKVWTASAWINLTEIGVYGK